MRLGTWTPLYQAFVRRLSQENWIEVIKSYDGKGKNTPVCELLAKMPDLSVELGAYVADYCSIHALPNSKLLDILKKRMELGPLSSNLAYQLHNIYDEDDEYINEFFRELAFRYPFVAMRSPYTRANFLKALAFSGYETMLAFWQRMFEELEKICKNEDAHSSYSSRDFTPESAADTYSCAIGLNINHLIEYTIGDDCDRIAQLSDYIIKMVDMMNEYARDFLLSGVASVKSIYNSQYALPLLKQIVRFCIRPGEDTNVDTLMHIFLNSEGQTREELMQLAWKIGGRRTLVRQTFAMFASKKGHWVLPDNIYNVLNTYRNKNKTVDRLLRKAERLKKPE